MAVAKVDSGGGFVSEASVSQITGSVTVTPGANRLVVGTMNSSATAGIVVSSVTYNGVALTQVAGAAIEWAVDATYRDTDIWTLANPPTGVAYNLVVTWNVASQYAAFGWASFSGVGSLGTAATDHSVQNSSNPTATVPDFVSGDLVFGVTATRFLVLTAQDTALWQIANSDTTLQGAAAYASVSGTVDWTSTAAGKWTVSAVGLKPPSAGNQTLLPPFLSSSSNFFTPTVSQGTVNLAPALFANAATFYAATVSTAAITVSLSAARNSGVAPLAVHFDGTGTIASGIAEPFHQLEYSWNFNDPASGATWTYGSDTTASKNTARGPVAAHCFETPGTYTVTMTVSNGTQSASATTNITVNDPDTVYATTNTICFSTSGNFAGAPAGSVNVTTSDFAAAVNTYAAAGKRLLFRKGEVFTANTPAAVNVAGPGTIGAFGTGAKPRVTSNTAVAGTAMIRFGVANSFANDWRLMDIEFDGQANGNAYGIDTNGSADQITVLRCYVHDVGNALRFSPDIIEYYHQNTAYPQHEYDQIAVVDSVFQTVTVAAVAYITGHRMALLGNLIDGSTTALQHACRVCHGYKSIFSNNNFGHSAPTKETFTLRAPDYTNHGVGEYYPGTLPGDLAITEMIVVSSNRFTAGNTTDTNVGVYPVNYNEDGRLRNILFERNLYKSGSGSQFNMVLQAQKMTVRNEVMDLTGAQYHTAVAVAGLHTAAASSNIWIYNNTIYSGSTGDFTVFRVWSDIGVTNCYISNNLCYAPNATGQRLMDSTGGGIATLTTNTSNAAMASSPSFVSATPTEALDFRIQAGSTARDSGTANSFVLTDFTGAARTAPYDIGAFEYGVGNLLTPLFQNVSTFFPHVLNGGLLGLVAALFANSPTFYAATVAFGASLQNMTPAFFANGTVYYAHAMAGGVAKVKTAGRRILSSFRPGPTGGRMR